ncbi:MAG: hypothetical protein ACYCTB_11110 [bacterium]
MKKFVFLILLFMIFTVSGCGYNSSFTDNYRKPLDSKQISKLNNIMFAYLNIPKLIKFSAQYSNPSTQKADNNFYQPSAVTKINKGQNKKVVEKLGKVVAKYNILVVNNVLYLTISGRQTVFIDKSFTIKKVNINIKKIKYDKGYEVVSLSLKNLGKKRIITENFKYSNAGAGESFKLKKYENIKNLTVASKYKKGMKLWLKF